jgi:hypothetical protein
LESSLLMVIPKSRWFRIFNKGTKRCFALIIGHSGTYSLFLINGLIQDLIDNARRTKFLDMLPIIIHYLFLENAVHTQQIITVTTHRERRSIKDVYTLRTNL